MMIVNSEQKVCWMKMRNFIVVLWQRVFKRPLKTQSNGSKDVGQKLQTL